MMPEFLPGVGAPCTAGKQAQKIQCILMIIGFWFAADICDTVCRRSAQIPESLIFGCCIKQRSRQLRSREDATEEPPCARGNKMLVLPIAQRTVGSWPMFIPTL